MNADKVRAWRPAGDLWLSDFYTHRVCRSQSLVPVRIQPVDATVWLNIQLGAARLACMADGGTEG